MKIKGLSLSNFKSFRQSGELSFGAFNVIVGPNAAGKTNLVQAVKFLKDIVSDGFENAFYEQGKTEYFFNSQLAKEESSVLKIDFELPETFFEADFFYDYAERRPRFILAFDIAYRQILKEISTNSTSKIEITEIVESNVLIEKGRDYDESNAEDSYIELMEKFNYQFSDRDSLKKLIISRTHDGKIHYGLFSGLPLPELDFHAPSVRLEKNELLLDKNDEPISELRDSLKSIGIYDFSTKLMKQSSSFKGKKDLERDGSNISLVLKDILADEEKNRKLHNLLEFALPHIKNIKVNESSNALKTTLSEIYNENFSLPSDFFSDGTIDIIALIVALYFEEKNIVIIEEPEKNVHPSLISKIVEMCKDASQHKQVIVTTHSPGFVKHAGRENLILIKRDEEGFSVAERIDDKEELKAFFKNEIGVEELFIENFFES
jgi:predicted ATPase